MCLIVRAKVNLIWFYWIWFLLDATEICKGIIFLLEIAGSASIDFFKCKAVKVYI